MTILFFKCDFDLEDDLNIDTEERGLNTTNTHVKYKNSISYHLKIMAKVFFF